MRPNPLLPILAVLNLAAADSQPNANSPSFILDSSSVQTLPYFQTPASVDSSGSFSFQPSAALLPATQLLGGRVTTSVSTQTYFAPALQTQTSNPSVRNITLGFSAVEKTAPNQAPTPYASDYDQNTQTLHLYAPKDTASLRLEAQDYGIYLPVTINNSIAIANGSTLIANPGTLLIDFGSLTHKDIAVSLDAALSPYSLYGNLSVGSNHSKPDASNTFSANFSQGMQGDLNVYGGTNTFNFTSKHAKFIGTAAFYDGNNRFDFGKDALFSGSLLHYGGETIFSLAPGADFSITNEGILNQKDRLIIQLGMQNPQIDPNDPQESMISDMTPPGFELPNKPITEQITPVIQILYPSIQTQAILSPNAAASLSTLTQFLGNGMGITMPQITTQASNPSATLQASATTEINITEALRLTLNPQAPFLIFDTPIYGLQTLGGNNALASSIIQAGDHSQINANTLTLFGTTRITLGQNSAFLGLVDTLDATFSLSLPTTKDTTQGVKSALLTQSSSAPSSAQIQTPYFQGTLNTNSFHDQKATTTLSSTSILNLDISLLSVRGQNASTHIVLGTPNSADTKLHANFSGDINLDLGSLDFSFLGAQSQAVLTLLENANILNAGSLNFDASKKAAHLTINANQSMLKTYQNSASSASSSIAAGTLDFNIKNLLTQSNLAESTLSIQADHLYLNAQNITTSALSQSSAVSSIKATSAQIDAAFQTRGANSLLDINLGADSMVNANFSSNEGRTYLQLGEDARIHATFSLNKGEAILAFLNLIQPDLTFSNTDASLNIAATGDFNANFTSPVSSNSSTKLLLAQSAVAASALNDIAKNRLLNLRYNLAVLIDFKDQANRPLSALNLLNEPIGRLSYQADTQTLSVSHLLFATFHHQGQSIHIIAKPQSILSVSGDGIQSLVMQQGSNYLIPQAYTRLKNLSIQSRFDPSLPATLASDHTIIDLGSNGAQSLSPSQITHFNLLEIGSSDFKNGLSGGEGVVVVRVDSQNSHDLSQPGDMGNQSAKADRILIHNTNPGTKLYFKPIYANMQSIFYHGGGSENPDNIAIATVANDSATSAPILSIELLPTTYGFITTPNRTTIALSDANGNYNPQGRYSTFFLDNTSKSSIDASAITLANSAFGIQAALFSFLQSSLEPHLRALKIHAHSHGFWSNLHSGKLHLDSGVQAFYNHLQIGYDHTFIPQEGLWRDVLGIGIGAGIAQSQSHRIHAFDSVRGIEHALSWMAEAFIYNTFMQIDPQSALNSGFYNDTTLRFLGMQSRFHLFNQPQAALLGLGMSAENELGYGFLFALKKQADTPEQPEDLTPSSFLSLTPFIKAGALLLDRAKFTQEQGDSRLEGSIKGHLILQGKAGLKLGYHYITDTHSSGIYIGTQYEYNKALGDPTKFLASQQNQTFMQSDPTLKNLLTRQALGVFLGIHASIAYRHHFAFEWKRSFFSTIATDFEVSFNYRYHF